MARQTVATESGGFVVDRCGCALQPGVEHERGMRRAAVPRVGALLFLAAIAIAPGVRSSMAGEDELHDPLLTDRRGVAVGAIEHEPPPEGRTQYGNPEKIERAIRQGCDYLIRQQAADGSFKGKADEDYRIGLTALAVLALMDAGHAAHESTPAGRAIQRGLSFLFRAQDEDGAFGDRYKQRFIYNHAFAAYAMVRAYAHSGGTALRRSAQSALNLTFLARNPGFAWRYGIKPGDNDTDVTGAAMLAVAEALEMNRRAATTGVSPPFQLDEGALSGVQFWLGKITAENTGRVGYLTRGTGPCRYGDVNIDSHPGENSECATAVAVWLRILMGADVRSDEHVLRGIELIDKLQPAWDPTGGRIDQLYWLWIARIAATPAPWGRKRIKAMDDWRRTAVNVLLAGQVRGSAVAGDGGSWPPIGAWGSLGGRIYSTSIMVSTLRVAAYGIPQREQPPAVQRRDVRAAPEGSLDWRLAQCEAVVGGASPDVVKALGRQLGDPLPVVRLAAAEALARIGPGAAAQVGKILERLAGEEHATIRHALVLALGRTGVLEEATLSVLRDLEADPEPGVRALAALVREARSEGASLGAIRVLHDSPDAAEALARLDRLGRLERSAAASRVAAVLDRLLCETGLPRQLGSRVGQRFPIVASTPLEQEEVLAAVEAAVQGGEVTAQTYAATRERYDRAVAAVEGSEAPPGARARLAAVLELYFMTAVEYHPPRRPSNWADRLNRHMAAIRALMPELTAHERLACRTLDVCLRFWTARTIEPMLMEYELLALEAGSCSELERWIELYRSQLWAASARFTKRRSHYARAWDYVLRAMDGPTDTTDTRRLTLRAAELALSIEQELRVPGMGESVGARLPPTAVESAVGKDGLRVELLDLARHVLVAPPADEDDESEARELPILVVRLRTTPTREGDAWNPLSQPPSVRVAHGKDGGRTPLAPYRPGVLLARVAKEGLGAAKPLLGQVTTGQSLVTTHVFLDRPDFSVYTLDVGVSGSGGGHDETLFSLDVRRDVILRRAPWFQPAEAVTLEVESRVPDLDLDPLPEAVDLLIAIAAWEVGRGTGDAAEAAVKRAEAAAQVLADRDRLEQVSRLRDALRRK